MQELDGHIDSIQGNQKGLSGVCKAMAKSRAAVQATLFDHIGMSEYNDVLGGLG
jgi:hypothetical protein